MPDQPEESAIEISTRPDYHNLGVQHPVDKPKRGLVHRVLRIVVLLLIVLGLLALIAPWLASTEPGTRWLASLVGSSTGAKVTIDDLEIGWFTGQSVSGLSYEHIAKGVRADFQQIDAPDVGLLSLITGGRSLGTITVTGVDVLYQQVPSQTPRPTGDESPHEPGAPVMSLPPTLSGSLVITDMKVAYAGQGIEPVVLTLPRGTLEVPGVRDIRFDFDASLQQGDRSGKVVFKGELLNLFDIDGYSQPMLARYDIESRVEGLSTVALDQLVSGAARGVRPGIVAALLGEGELVARGTVNGIVSELDAELHAESPNARLDLYQEREGDTLVAAEKSTAGLTLTPEGFAALFPDSELELIESTAIQMSKLQVMLPLKNDAFDWDKASTLIEIKAGASQNLALKDKSGKVIGVEALRLGGGGESIARQLKFDLTAMLTAVDAGGAVQREPLEAELLVKRPLDAEREISFFSGALPVALADALGGMDGRLVLWLGEALELEAVVSGKRVKQPDGSSKLVQVFALRPGPTGRLTGEVSGQVQSRHYQFSTPEMSPLEATLVPEAFASLMEMLSGKPGKPALTIDKPMPVRITLREGGRPNAVTTSAGGPGVRRFYPDPDRTVLGATIQLSPARVYDPNRDKTYELRGGSLSISAPDLRGRADIKADLRLWVRPDAGKEGVPALLTYQTTVTDLLDSEGGIPLDAAAFMQQVALAGGVTLDQAPSGLLDSLLNRNGDIASILGPVVQQMDARFTYDDGRPTGASVKLNWDEKNNQPITGAWASMNPVQFDIDDQQMLTVSGGQDIEIQVRVSEAFGDRWMGQLHPILFDAKSADRPVKIKIDGASFRFPLKDKQMAGSMVQAEIDLGSIEFGEDAMLGKLLEWTDHKGDRAVFEPAKVKLVDGQISYDAVDMAVGNVRLRLDGEVDLVDGQIVDMAVRVPGKSLIKVFNELDGVIPPDDYLNIPMTGPIRKPEFDNKLIGREVARLLTRGLIDRQRDKVRAKVRDELDIKEGKPADELIDNALDLLFGGKKRKPAPNKQPEQKPAQQPENKPAQQPEPQPAE